MNKNSSGNLIRPLVRELHPYVYGEQPKIKGLIKLNTNENPYPPSPKVLAAVKAAVDGRLRLYPNPTAERLREKLAKLHGCRRRTSSRATARMNCWRWPRGALWSRIQSLAELDPPKQFNTLRQATRCIRCWRTFMAR